jgi:NAD(P)-dependent dehydrogenase (short-subunit alcohol dehydrogenase family)
MARALADKSATVILACRNRDKGEAAVRQIRQEYPEAEAELLQVDLSELASVRRFADEFTSHYNRLMPSPPPRIPVGRRPVFQFIDRWFGC